MSNPKWLVIAKNEYRLQTSWIRSLRRVFPFLATGLLVAWIFYLAPVLVQGSMTEFQGFMASQVALAVFELILFSFSFFLVLVPVTNTLRDEGVNRMELMLKSPVRPGDVLVGEFLGKTPIYAIIATFTIGLFTALLAPLGLSLLQTTLVIFMAFVTCLSSFWVGTVIAGVARTTIGRTAKGKDLGKALAFILALPLVAVFYSLINGDLFNILLNPSTDGLVKAVLGLFPSSWTAEVIVAFANNPGNIAAVLELTLIRVGGMMVFMVGSLWLGWMVTDRAFSLEPTNLGATKVSHDSVLYKTVRLLGGRSSFGSLLVSAFKDYARRLENLTQLGYVVGLLVLMQVFFIDDLGGSQTMGLIMGTVMALFMSSEATIRGKETLFIYRKTPGGVGRFMKAKLVQTWLLVLPLLVLNMILTVLRFEPGFTVGFFLSNGKVILMAAANSAMAIGLALVNPAWVQKSPAYMINMQLIAFLAFGSIIIPNKVFHQEWLQLPMALTVGFVMLFLGYRKLSNME